MGKGSSAYQSHQECKDAARGLRIILGGLQILEAFVAAIRMIKRFGKRSLMKEAYKKGSWSENSKIYLPKGADWQDIDHETIYMS